MEFWVVKGGRLSQVGFEALLPVPSAVSRCCLEGREGIGQVKLRYHQRGIGSGAGYLGHRTKGRIAVAG